MEIITRKMVSRAAEEEDEDSGDQGESTCRELVWDWEGPMTSSRVKQTCDTGWLLTSAGAAWPISLCFLPATCSTRAVLFLPENIFESARRVCLLESSISVVFLPDICKERERDIYLSLLFVDRRGVPDADWPGIVLRCLLDEVTWHLELRSSKRLLGNLIPTVRSSGNGFIFYTVLRGVKLNGFGIL